MDRLLPNGKPPNPSVVGMKCKFTREEDMKLKYLVEQSFMNLSWKDISIKMKTRTPRQCRERYKNYLSNKVTHNQWTEQEDQYILTKYEELGKVWNVIAKGLPGRTGNAVRNRWKYLTSKKEKKMKSNKNEQPKTIASVLLPSSGSDTQMTTQTKTRSSSSDDDVINQMYKKMLNIPKNDTIFGNSEEDVYRID